jgi:subtilisin family serine protease
MTGLDDGSSCAAGVPIGLVDSGVAEHPALRGIEIRERSFLDAAATTDAKHGTAVAALLVGATAATAPLAAGASLHSAIVFDGEAETLRADVTAIVAALDWLAQSQVRLVNLSLAGPPNLLLEQAVQAAADLGMVLVAAAGNGGPDAPPVYPGGYPSVIAVAAVDWRGRPYEMNNRGPHVEIAAPGVDVLSARAEGGTAYWTGTSFAVPFVTAALARGLAEGTVTDVTSARRRLADTARDLGPVGRDPVYGWGLLQATACGG